MKKNGKTLQDIFAPTTRPAAGKAAPAAAAAEPSDVVKGTFFFTQDQLDYLDKQTKLIRRASGKTVKRTALVRALLEALREADMDLSSCSTEDHVRQAFRVLLGGRSQLKP